MTPPSPEEKPFMAFPDGPGGKSCKFRTWSAEEWDRIPPERRPPGAVRFGDGWIELILDERPGA